MRVFLSVLLKYIVKKIQRVSLEQKVHHVKQGDQNEKTLTHFSFKQLEMSMKCYCVWFKCKNIKGEIKKKKFILVFCSSLFSFF